MLGFRLELDLVRLELPVDRAELAAAASMSPEERLREAAAWNRFATAVTAAGKGARGR